MHGDEIEAREVSVDDEPAMRTEVRLSIDHRHIICEAHVRTTQGSQLPNPVDVAVFLLKIGL